MNNDFVSKFLEYGCVLGIPSENKVWCMAFEKNSFFASQNLNPPYFYLNDFYMSKSTPFCKGSLFFEFSYEDLLEKISNLKYDKPNIQWFNINKNNYINQFESLKIEINKSILKKGVPYSFLEGNAEVNIGNKIYLLKKLLENKSNNNSSYIYGYWDKNDGYLGATPELLFIQKNKFIHTIALAGTIANEPCAKKEEFLSDIKMQKEHFYVIEGIKQSLLKYGHVSIGDTSLLELPKLIHLKTNINIDLNNKENFNFEQFLMELHPTPAIGRLPKNSDSKWLSKTEKEKLNRGYYASPFGLVLDEKNSICVCTIRGIQWQGNKVKICAGGGVIKESQFDLEWEEIISKINGIKYNLGV